MFKYILFDLDGTLTDTSEGITKSVQFALMQRGIKEDNLKNLYRFIGPPLTDSFMEYYGFSEDEAQNAVLDFRKRYDPVGVYENKIYPGIDNMLAELRKEGCRLLVASSKPEYLVYKVLEKLNIKQYFDVIAGSPADEKGYYKEDVMDTALWELIDIIEGKTISTDAPREEFVTASERNRGDIEEMLDKHDINKTTCAMVGDRHFDILAAHNLGVCAVGVSFGFAPKGELEAAGADMIAHDTNELLRILKGESEGAVKKN